MAANSQDHRHKKGQLPLALETDAHIPSHGHQNNHREAIMSYGFSNIPRLSLNPPAQFVFFLILDGHRTPPQ
jgi:hypothetical protein